MRTTVDLNEDLIKEAMILTKISQKTMLLHAGLEALIAQFAQKKLSELGGMKKNLKAPKRKKFDR